MTHALLTVKWGVAAGVTVAVGVRVGVPVGAGTGVSVAVGGRVGVSFAAAADVRVGVLDGEDACKPAAVGVRVGVPDGVGLGVSVGAAVGVRLGSGACEPGAGLAAVACSSLCTRVDSAPTCSVQGRLLHQEEGQQDERGDYGGDSEKSEDESEESFHGGFSGCGAAVWLFKVAGQRVFHPGAAERPGALKVLQTLRDISSRRFEQRLPVLLNLIFQQLRKLSQKRRLIN